MNKTKLSLIFILLFSLECFSQQTANNGITQTAVKNGIGIGSVIAIVVSWDRNKSILYAILHGILGWLYVIYFVIVRESEEKNKSSKTELNTEFSKLLNCLLHPNLKILRNKTLTEFSSTLKIGRQNS